MSLRHDEGTDAQPAPAGKIKVVCHGCGARYQVRDSKVRGHRFRATCKRCGGIIVARCTNAFTVMPDESRSGRGPAARSVEAVRLGGDDLQQEDEPTWYVVIAGKPHGPLSPIQVRKSFHAHRITPKTYLWRSGDPEWRRLIDVPEFVDLFREAPTGFYDAPSTEVPGVPHSDGSGETHAAGPKGLRRRSLQEDVDPARDHFLAAGTLDPDRGRVIAPSPSEESAEYHAEYDAAGTRETQVRAAVEDYGPESVYEQPTIDEPYDQQATASDGQATRLRAHEELGPLEGGDQPWPDEEPPPRRGWQRPEEEPPPVVPRRKAVLPSPTGMPRRFESKLPPPAMTQAPPPPPTTAAAFSTGPGEGPEVTRQMRDDERLEVRAGPPPALPFPKPGSAPPPAVAPPFAALSPPLPLPSATPLVSAPPLGYVAGPGVAARGGASPLGSLVPGLAPPPASPFADPAPAGPPPVASAFDVALKPIGPAPVMLPIKEEEEEEGFWSAGKIAAVAAIAGGLAVALTVILVVVMMRPKQRTIILNATAQSSQKRGPVTESKPSPPPPPLPEAKITVRSEEPAAKAAAAAPKAEEKKEKKADKPEPKAEGKKAEAKPEPTAAAPAAEAGGDEDEKPAPKAARKSDPPKAVAAHRPDEGTPTRTKLRKAAKAASALAEPRPAKKAKAAVDVDELLTGGGGGPKKSAPAKKAAGAGASSVADDILAGAAQQKKAAPKPAPEAQRPSREQIMAAMRAVTGRVRACYDKHRQSGRVEVQVTLRPDGSHSQVAVGSFAGTPTGECVAAAVAAARFAPFSGAVFAFKYPFILQ
jgi:hypothetical protein